MVNMKNISNVLRIITYFFLTFLQIKKYFVLIEVSGVMELCGSMYKKLFDILLPEFFCD